MMANFRPWAACPLQYRAIDFKAAQQDMILNSRITKAKRMGRTGYTLIPASWKVLFPLLKPLGR